MDDSTQQNAAIALQTSIRRWSQEQAFQEQKRISLKRLGLRGKAALEIFSSEETYVSSLSNLISRYLDPLKSAVGTETEIISKREISALFSNVESIYTLSVEVLNSLKTRTEDWSQVQLLGDIFSNLGSYFKIYSIYCNNYEQAMQVYKEAAHKNTSFREFLGNETVVLNADKLDLPSFLILPIQRIPRYVLLLKTLYDLTPDNHPDKQNILKGHHILEDVAIHLNESMKDAERMNKLLSLEQRFGFTLELIDPTRKFICEGLVMKITSRFVKETNFFLFSDILVYAYFKSLSSCFKYKGTIKMGTAWVRDLPDTEQLQNAFQIVGKEKTYTVFTHTPKEKLMWMSSLNKVIDNLVALNPDLLARRATSIKVTERNAVGDWFFGFFTYKAGEYDRHGRNSIIIREEAERARVRTLQVSTNAPAYRSVHSEAQLDTKTPLLRPKNDSSGCCCHIL